MNPIDAFLLRHEVDVGKSFGLLSLAGAVVAFYGIVGALFVGRVNVDLSAPIGFIIGVALWRHASWPRTLLLVISCAAVAVFAGVLVAVPFAGTAFLTLTLGSVVIKNAPTWQVYASAVLMAPSLWLILSVLHSERAKAEFQKPPQRNAGSRPLANDSPASEHRLRSARVADGTFGKSSALH